MRKPLHRIRVTAILLAASGVGALSGFARENAVPIPAEKIAAFQYALTADMNGASAARKRLAVKRIVRDAEALLDSNQAAPNRFELLDVLFRAQRDLLEWENSPRTARHSSKPARPTTLGLNLKEAQRVHAEVGFAPRGISEDDLRAIAADIRSHLNLHTVVGVCTSGHYVRTARSPSLDDLENLLVSWS